MTTPCQRGDLISTFLSFHESPRTEDDMKQEPYLLTIKEAAIRLGIPYRQLLEAANANEIPYYQVGKSRRLVSVSEILESMKYNSKGENND